jgi:hypothetical protein
MLKYQQIIYTEKKMKNILFILAVFCSAAAHSQPAANLNSSMILQLEKTAALIADSLDSSLGDRHEAALKTKNFTGPEAEEIIKTLKQLREKSGALYAYTMIKKSNRDAALMFDSENPSDSGKTYPMEPPMGKAFTGRLSADEGIWEDEKGNILKSVYLPLKNSKNRVTAIIGLDFPLEKKLSEANSRFTAELYSKALKYSAELKGLYADYHAAMVQKGGRNNTENIELQKKLREIQKNMNAVYVYTMHKKNDKTMIIICDAAKGSAADPYGTEYPLEPYMNSSLAGEIKADKGIWLDPWSGNMMKSVTIPLTGSSGKITGLLGIDLPVDFNAAPFNN